MSELSQNNAPCALYRNRFGDGCVLSLYDSLLIGRSPRAGLFVPDPAVSRWHCVLLRCSDQSTDNRGWMLMDLGSRNGTYLDGERLRGPRRLRLGNRVQFGRIHEVILIGLASSAEVVAFDARLGRRLEA